MSIEHLHNENTSQLPCHHSDLAANNHADAPDQRAASMDDSIGISAHTFHAQHAPTSPSPAIDVNRLSVSNLAQKNEQDNAEVSSRFDASFIRAPASVLADDSFESLGSVMGEDSKNEIRRRRRTRPDEANLLAQVYAKNPFPDHETRLFLANRVGMSVR